MSAQNAEYPMSLRATQFIDSEHPSVIEFANRHAGEAVGKLETAIALYKAVRDEIYYDPYNIDQTITGFKASHCIETGFGYCITKAAALAAVARAKGIPARVGYADVRNHLSSPRLSELMKTDIFVFHGFTELFIGEKWVKATPAFNLSLCQKAHIEPLDFNGVDDSIFQAFDKHGRLHMEYVKNRPSYIDVPRDEIMSTWRTFYPEQTGWGYENRGGSMKWNRQFETDVESTRLN